MIFYKNIIFKENTYVFIKNNIVDKKYEKYDEYKNIKTIR